MATGNDLLSSSWTGREIRQQPEVWRGTARSVAGLRDEVDRLLAAALADPRTRVVLTGAGTSAFAGQVVAPDLSRLLGRQVEAVATTDVVSAPRSVLAGDHPVLLVSLARSGSSPESVAAVDVVDALAPAVHHLVITCNAEGELARRCAGAENAVVVTLPPESNDRGFAMTSSFTAMALATLLCFGVDVDVDALADAATEVLDGLADLATGVAATDPRRLVYLGSGPLKGLASESALKCLELTAGGLPALGDSSMAFRHGPKAVLDDATLAVVYLSGDPGTRVYDQDIAAELLAALGPDRVAVVDDEEPAGARWWRVPRGAGWPDAVWALVAVLPAQATALACSVAAGLTPDDPFPGGEVNRVVQGVRIHPLPRT
ncbi:SIS domain-containing protein [Kineococcus sp. R8]|uniref:SIS domain-containing protein n=1 Tax=Kineococcus siccus TaxID=2696567 RepID=UPI0014123560|nr:SIS domain-containing protein [Kineococcus siccus]NAZ82763.1 SIS domain-containing protein [Kineococcus siccus]